jgi:FtsP/CotA-like multicopper oxidase with cupredoxin domain
MNFINRGQDEVRQSGFKLLGWPILILAGALLAPQESEAREWEFNLPLSEISASPSDEQIQKPLHVDEGDGITVHIINNTPFKHTIRWHGTHQADKWRNSNMPEMAKRFLSIQKTIEAGENFTYHWKAKRIGTFWYHCHVNTSKQTGISARQAASYQGG